MRRALITTVFLAAAIPVSAADAGGDAPRIGDRLRRVFADRLRAEIAMTDEQASVVLPKLEEIERVRTKARREKLGMSQRDLAKAAGLHQPRVVELEAGKRANISLDTLERLAKALKVKPATLLK